MIQRLQSAWLCLAAIFAALTFVKPFFLGTSDLTPMHNYDASSFIMVAILTVIIAVFSIFLIFLYKNRKTQMFLTIIDLVLALLLIALYYFQTKDLVGGIQITAIFTLAIPIFLALAVKGIYKDIKLVKSVDRLRD